MLSVLPVPIMDELVQRGVPTGANLLVEFDPRSLWYETSFTIAARALKNGTRVDYHTFIRAPNEVRNSLSRFRVDVDKLEQDQTLRVIDSYTTQIGLNLSEEPRGSAKIETVAEKSLKLSDWSIGWVKELKEAPAEIDKKRLHIDDNSSVLLQYNDEKVIIDVWRTRNLPHTRVRESVFLYALLTEVGSPSFQKQLESISDGIVEFKSEDKEGRIEQYVRVSAMRGRSYDSRWRRLQLLDNGEVKLVG